MEGRAPCYGKLTRSGEYRQVYDSGNKLVGRYLVLFYRAAPDGFPMLGITVSGKIGGAVVRNRHKRRIREALRIMYGPPAGDASSQSGIVSRQSGGASFKAGDASGQSGIASFKASGVLLQADGVSGNFGDDSGQSGGASFKAGNASLQFGGASGKVGGASGKAGVDSAPCMPESLPAVEMVLVAIGRIKTAGFSELRSDISRLMARVRL